MTVKKKKKQLTELALTRLFHEKFLEGPGPEYWANNHSPRYPRQNLYIINRIRVPGTGPDPQDRIHHIISRCSTLTLGGAGTTDPSTRKVPVVTWTEPFQSLVQPDQI